MPQIQCSHCGKKFFRSDRRITEAKKRGWQRPYCSLKCLGLSRVCKRRYKCANPSCDQTFTRTPSEFISVDRVFCSTSCAAIVNNRKFPRPRRARIKICYSCHKEFTGKEKYCSVECQIIGRTVKAEEIIAQIQEFYKRHGRIPLKREFFHYKAARGRFGTWNNAIKAAGYEPHPVMFAKKYIANDGHHCDSLAEKIIDDFLSIRNIPHLRSVPYNRDGMTADFKVGDTWIEFLGLQGELKSYDRLVNRKKKLWKERKLNIIQIYPKDLLPESRLNKTLNLLQHH